MKRSAFTLVEILFATVLLTLVISVCVPFLRAPNISNSEADRTEFLARVDEEIARFGISNNKDPSEKQLRTLFQPIGIQCQNIGDHNKLLGGQWVLFSNGHFETIRWASVDPVREGDTE